MQRWEDWNHSTPDCLVPDPACFSIHRHSIGSDPPLRSGNSNESKTNVIDGVDVVDVLLQKLCPKSLLYHSLTRTQVPIRPPPPRGYICQPRRQWTIKVRTQRGKKSKSLCTEEAVHAVDLQKNKEE